MTRKFTESVVKDAALEWLGELGYAYVGGPDIAPGEAAAEREAYTEVVLAGRLGHLLLMSIYVAMAILPWLGVRGQRRIPD